MLLQWLLVIEKFLDCLLIRFPRKKIWNTVFQMELWVSVLLCRFSYFWKSSQKSSKPGLVPRRLQKLCLLPHSSLEGLPAFKSPSKDQHHSKRPKSGQDRAFCTKLKGVWYIWFASSYKTNKKIHFPQHPFLPSRKLTCGFNYDPSSPTDDPKAFTQFLANLLKIYTTPLPSLAEHS